MLNYYRYLYRLFCWMLPDRLIRILFISSLFSQLYQINRIDLELYNHINQLLKVSENDYAVGAGVSFGKMLWVGVELTQESYIFNSHVVTDLSIRTEEVIARELINKTPDYLRYNYCDMLYDIRNMLDNRFKLSQLAA